MDKKPYLTIERIAELFITGCLASVSSELVVYPLEVAKTRLQIQGESSNPFAQKGGSRGFFGIAKGIIKEEGFIKLYSGFSAVLVRHLCCAGVKLTTYEYLRNNFKQINDQGKEVLSMGRCTVAGFISGVCTVVASNPLDLVKLQLQMESRRRFLGMAPRSINITQTFRQIYAHGGIRSLFRGFMPNAIGIGLYTVGGISGYDLSKREIRKRLQCEDTIGVQFISSMAAGLACAIMSSPADVVKSRIMNQPIDEHGRGTRYKNSWECLQMMIREEGPFAIYKGFIPYWLRCGPWFLIFWMSFETIRRLNGDASF